MAKKETCQSCGMPLKSIGDFGTEANGSASDSYCCYCYQHGKFTDEGITKEEKMNSVSVVLQSKMFASKEKADKLTVELFNHLERWN